MDASLDTGQAETASAYGGGAAASAPPAPPPPPDERGGFNGDPAADGTASFHTMSPVFGHYADDEEAPLARAAAGVADATQPLPFADRIQAAFGGFDLSDVRVETGARARQASAAMGADAYATDGKIGFGVEPTLRLAAHEAAHVVQQRGGVQLSAGVGQSGDVYERHADAVADRVVRGESAEALLGELAGGGGGGMAVQRSDAGNDLAPPGESEMAPGGAHQPEPQSPEEVAANKERWGEFVDQCTAAINHLIICYEIGSLFVHDCVQSYEKGFADHEAALEAQGQRDRLTNELILGVVFAGVGGAAGGATAALAGPMIKAIITNATAQAAVTDAAKDLAKYLARLPPQLAPSGGGAGSKTPASPPPATPTAPQAKQGGGASGPAGVDPRQMGATAARALSEEKVAAHVALQAMFARARIAKDTGEPFLLDFDPLRVLEESCTVNGTKLSMLGTLAIPSALEYERAFWECWLSQYAHKVQITTGHGHSVANPVSNVGKDVLAEIDRVAQHFGETGEAWVERYGAPAQQAAAEQARAQNQAALGGVGP
jgi:Domain of unknown function (DUF4157)